MSENIVESLFDELSSIPEVEAIALGGSRSGTVYDEKSDYDVYLYCTESVSENIRREILSKYCSTIEIGNHFWEYEDNCTLNNGIDIDILYRNLDRFCDDVASVVEQCHARNGYTTCMWHNLLTCKIIFDRNGRLSNAKKRFSVPYPQELKRNIIERNMKLLSDSLPAYKGQIAKSIKRNDYVSICHRTAAFMESYFDIIFAVNELTHPGEKRLVQLCKDKCSILPKNFEENITSLYEHSFTDSEIFLDDIARIIVEVKKTIIFSFTKDKSEASMN